MIYCWDYFRIWNWPMRGSCLNSPFTALMMPMMAKTNRRSHAKPNAMILRSFSSATLRENEDSYMALFLSHSRAMPLVKVRICSCSCFCIKIKNVA